MQIKNSKYLSLQIRSVDAPHYPTRRPALGTLITLPWMGYTKPNVATVVAIEQTHWPTEWTYTVLAD